MLKGMPDDGLAAAGRIQIRCSHGVQLSIEDRLGRSPYDLDAPVMVVGARGRQELSVRSKIVRDIAGKQLHARYYLPQEDLKAVQALLKRA